MYYRNPWSDLCGTSVIPCIFTFQGYLTFKAFSSLYTGLAIFKGTPKTVYLGNSWFDVHKPSWHLMLLSLSLFHHIINPSTRIPVLISGKYFVKDPFILQCEIIFSTSFFECIQCSSLPNPPKSTFFYKRKGRTLKFPRNLWISYQWGFVSRVCFFFCKLFRMLLS